MLLVGFIIRIYHDTRSSEYQIRKLISLFMEFWIVKVASQPLNCPTLFKGYTTYYLSSFWYFFPHSGVFLIVTDNTVLFWNYNQQDATIFYYLFVKRSTCFGRFLRPSSGAHKCTLSFMYCQPILLQADIVGKPRYQPAALLVDYLKLSLQLCAADDGRRNRPKHVQPFTNK